MEHLPGWFDLLLANFSHNIDGLKHLFGWPLNEEGQSWIWGQDVSYVGHIAGFVLMLVLLIVVGLSIRSKLADVQAALIPEDRLTVRTFVELIVEATYGQLVAMMGEKAARHFLPLIGTCALLIFASNFLGLIPGFVPPTDNLNTTLAMAMVIFVVTHIYGVKEHGVFKYLKHFAGPIWWLAPMIFVIEIISHIVRPLSLSVRLMANMTADHMVLAIFLGLVPFLVPLPMYALGLIVVTVQTLVFCLLSAVYISMAIAHEEH